MTAGPVRPPDAWNHYFAAARGEQSAERRRLHGAALAALLLHGLIFALRLPESARPSVEITTAVPFRLEDFRIRPRPVEPPPPTTETPPPVARPTIIVPGPPEVDIVPTASFEPVAVETTVPQIEPIAVLPAPPPPPDTEPVRYDTSIERPVKIYAPLPSYSPAARRIRLEGSIILEAVIDEAGLVQDLVLLKGLGWGLDESALETVSTWRFEPARRDGRPIAVIYNLVIHFNLG